MVSRMRRGAGSIYAISRQSKSCLCIDVTAAGNNHPLIKKVNLATFSVEQWLSTRVPQLVLSYGSKSLLSALPSKLERCVNDLGTRCLAQC